MLFKSNTALGYNIALDNALTAIFYILRYSLILTAAKELSNVTSARFCFVCKTNLVPRGYLLFHLNECQHLILVLMFDNAFTPFLEKELIKRKEMHFIQEILKILKISIFDAYFKFW